MPSDPPPSDPRAEDRSVLGRPAPAPARTWPYGSAADQVADLYLPDPVGPQRRTVVLVHGGFWRPAFDRTHLRPLASALAARGHRVLSLEYRRVPGQPDLATGDVRQALAAVRADPGFPGRPCVVGHSAGGHLALWLAAQPGPAVDVIALAPVADLSAADRLGLDDDAVRAFLGAEPRARPDLDPVHLAPAGPGVALLHGTSDSLVPLSQSRAYAQAHPDARLTELAGIGHFEPIDPSARPWPTLLKLLDGGIE
ncbi:MAG: alpha/beta hydrolase family protein [Candidatus Nanopelagicales bacterium]